MIPIALLVALWATVVFADHSWTNSGGDVYHWKSNNLSPTVENQTKQQVFNTVGRADVSAAIVEWANLGTAIQPTEVNRGDQVVVKAKRSSPSLLGRARIWLEQDTDGQWHITAGEVLLNTLYLNSLTDAQWDHLACQEFGHIWGLDHNRVGDSSPDDATCMNDDIDVNLNFLNPSILGLYTSPNGHDTAHLNAIYNGHPDVTAEEPPPPDDGGSGGGPPCSKKPNHPNCDPNKQGKWITVHEFPAP